MWVYKTILVSLVILYCQNGYCQSVDSTNSNSKVAGVYQIIRIATFADGKSIQDVDMTNPILIKRSSTTITAKYKTPSVVTLQLQQYSDTTIIMTSFYGDATLQKSVTGYDFFLKEKKIGSTNGKHLVIDMENTDLQTGIVKRAILEGERKE